MHVQDQQSPFPTAETGSSSSSFQRSMRITEASLVRALSGVLLMLLSDDTAQSALLAPGQGISSDVATVLRQLQESRVRGLVQQSQASIFLGILRSAGSSSGSSSSAGQQQLPVAVMSREVTARLEQVCQAFLQQVLLCCTWADAATAAGGAAAAAGPVAAASSTASGSSSSRRSWYTLAAKSTVRASANTPSGGAAVVGQHPGRFDWQGLVQSLQQAAETAAGVCQLQHQQRQQPPEAYLCPISRELMRDPVVACDGHTYERRAITEWIKVS
jgi:hypothetical protein